MSKYAVLGRVGGPGTFWEGHEYHLGIYRWLWLARLRSWYHVTFENPMRMSWIEKIGR